MSEGAQSRSKTPASHQDPPAGGGDRRRIERAFARARQDGRAALIGYLTAYFPDRARSLAAMCAALDSGVDVLEIGVPFSDPSADGLAIQTAMVQARRAGATLAGCLQLIAELRAQRPEAALVLFSYANPLLALTHAYARGQSRAGVSTVDAASADGDPPSAWDAGVAAVAAAGADGVLIVDAPHDAAHGLRAACRAHGVAWIGLVAPTTAVDRARAIAADSDGFVYAISMAAVTGAEIDTEGADFARLTAQLAMLRAAARVPVAVGFGVRTPAHVGALANAADGVVVGSALVRAAGDTERTGAVGQVVAALSAATRR